MITEYPYRHLPFIMQDFGTLGTQHRFMTSGINISNETTRKTNLISNWEPPFNLHTDWYIPNNPHVLPINQNSNHRPLSFYYLPLFSLSEYGDNPAASERIIALEQNPSNNIPSYHTHHITEEMQRVIQPNTLITFQLSTYFLAPGRPPTNAINTSPTIMLHFEKDGFQLVMKTMICALQKLDHPENVLYPIIYYWLRSIKLRSWSWTDRPSFAQVVIDSFQFKWAFAKHDATLPDFVMDMDNYKKMRYYQNKILGSQYNWNFRRLPLELDAPRVIPSIALTNIKIFH
jgi:hypothetical protein